MKVFWVKLKTSVKTQKRPLDQLYWTKLALELAIFAISQVIKFLNSKRRKVVEQGYINSKEHFLNMNPFPKRTLFPRSIMNIIILVFLRYTNIKLFLFLLR